MNKKVIERILKNLLENETYTIDKEESEILLDYITNLQEENERVSNLYQTYEEANDLWIKKYEDYKSRNEKAIELLEPLIELNGTMATKGMYKLLNILEKGK